MTHGFTTCAYLGPEGTFTQAALHRLPPPGAGTAHRAFPSVPAALDAVRRGECGAAVVPLENSVRGVVPATMDELARAGLHITAEVEVEVAFALMAPPGTDLADVTEVLSHPHALGQCADWLAEHLPGARTRPADSTAAAAREVAEAGPAGLAAVAAPPAAGLYGLRTLATGLGRRAGAVTRFVRVAQPWFPPARTREDRTSLVVAPGDGGPGGLAEVLRAFASRGIEVSRVHSWPTGERLGSYRYFVDAEGHIENPAVREAVSTLTARSVDVRFLGSYPRWTGDRAHRPGTTAAGPRATAA
ncbi:prephenate dehydratase [Streptomyces capillispiralis]|uniref:Prephenate dehydratase n=1 Tax=Streptomyces capillispiralis TaxID=68182 RepID=A0A561TCB6_9ACTN|nr:prephenate dehydratase [Streptomyces capillispiralis]TWF84746.1 prephenate dehydratase [Streptomyces capillispiralis]GHE24271.1 prephenate dehydratase [Streptomyces capillispiralis]